MARPNHDTRHLRRLRDLYSRAGCIPSYSQMAQWLGFKAKNAAFKLTQRLISSGHLVKTTGGRLAPGPDFFTLDISEDEVRAGFGAEGSATGLVQAQTLEQLLISKPSRTVFVKLRGDSMEDIGILHGDVAVVETSVEATQGDIVIAEIDGSTTVKELLISDGRAQLVPHGRGMKPVFPQNSLSIIGVVRGIVRSFRPSPATAKLPKWGIST